MNIDANLYQAPEGAAVVLDQWATRGKPLCKSKKGYDKALQDQIEQLSAQQRLLYASDRHALLLIFQAMDTAGKDGAIRHVMSGVNPQGCQVFSFQHPSAQELEHDFLWRTTRHLPERGRIGIFNRSYYEEVLIVRVHSGILRSQGVCDLAAGESVWTSRFRSIVELERHLHANGTRVVKVYLHLSKDEQRKRLLARIDEPEKNWKFSLAGATSTADSPWFIVPADDKFDARLIVSHIVLDALLNLKMHYPKVSPARRRELKAIRKQLVP